MSHHVFVQQVRQSEVTVMLKITLPPHVLFCIFSSFKKTKQNRALWHIICLTPRLSRSYICGVFYWCDQCRGSQHFPTRRKRYFVVPATITVDVCVFCIPVAYQCRQSASFGGSECENHWCCINLKCKHVKSVATWSLTDSGQENIAGNTTTVRRQIIEQRTTVRLTACLTADGEGIGW